MSFWGLAHLPRGNLEFPLRPPPLKNDFWGRVAVSTFTQGELRVPP